jgi:hypothetical protein
MQENGARMRRRMKVSLIAALLAVHCSGVRHPLKSTPVLEPFDLRRIQAEGEIGRRMNITLYQNILKLDLEKDFLKLFRCRSAEPEARDGFVGTGMLLDALVRFAYASRDSEIIRLKSYVAAELLKTRDSDGYMGIWTPDKRMQGWDTHEGGYIILALANDYALFGEAPSLGAAGNYADLLISKNVQTITGLEDAFLALYRQTRDRRYLEYCREPFGLHEFRGGSAHHSRHVYGFLERCLMQVYLHRIEPDTRLLYKPRVAVEHLVNMDGMDVIGTAGMWEHMNTSQEGHDCNGETCATAYILWLMDALLQAEGNPFYGDIMERTLYNALFAAQSPDGRRLRYFTDTESAKEYYPDDSFCCPNNFRRILSNLPGFLYYRTARGIAVNLYSASKADIEIGRNRITVEQVTDYPSNGRITLLIHPSAKSSFDLSLRIPLWCRNATVSLNGEPVKEPVGSGVFFTIVRSWEKGDRVELTLPMAWRIVRGRGRQYGKAALMRGPVVFGMNRSDNGYLKEGTDIRVDLNSISDPMPDNRFRPGGLKCTAAASDAGGGAWRKLVFTEFVDPEGIKTFFLPAGEESRIIDDEFVTRHY